MTKVDLITGFLGSGKTTFLIRYARHLAEMGERIGIIENDYGAVNIDRMLLEEAVGDLCDLEMVIGGDYDCHRRRFKTKLITLGMLGYDRVIVEPSGIYDVDELFDLLHEEPLDRWYEAGSVIAIVDAHQEKMISDESAYFLMTQTAEAGAIIFSKTQNCPEHAPAEALSVINGAYRRFGCRKELQLPAGADSAGETENRDPVRTDSDVKHSPMILTKNWDDLTGEDLDAVSRAGFIPTEHIKLPLDRENQYTTLFYMNKSFLPEELKAIVQKLFADENAGHILRIKGFTGDGDSWFELNATREDLTLRRTDGGQEIIIVIGENLKRELVDPYFAVSGSL